MTHMKDQAENTFLPCCGGKWHQPGLRSPLLLTNCPIDSPESPSCRGQHFSSALEPIQAVFRRLEMGAWGVPTVPRLGSGTLPTPTVSLPSPPATNSFLSTKNAWGSPENVYKGEYHSGRFLQACVFHLALSRVLKKKKNQKCILCHFQIKTSWNRL